MTTAVACVFPGQGSQFVGMLAELAEQFPSVEAVFARGSDALGFDLWRLCQEDNDGKLDQTEFTQPALLAAGFAVYQVWHQQTQLTPQLVAGHSLGEYTALVASGALAFTDAIKLVALRGQLMQKAVAPGEGAMAAIIGLDDDAVVSICQQAAEGDVVSPANYNAHGQVVIAGTDAAVERAIKLAEAQNARMAKKLAVSVPSHSSLMRPAADELAEALQSINIDSPLVPLVCNVNAEATQEPGAIRTALVNQLYQPVQWVKTIEHMAAYPIDLIIECGPGKVLQGLNKRINKQLTTLSIFSPESLTAALQR